MTDVSPGPPQEGPTLFTQIPSSLEFLQREGVGTEHFLVAFISDPRDPGLESEWPTPVTGPPTPER